MNGTLVSVASGATVSGQNLDWHQGSIQRKFRRAALRLSVAIGPVCTTIQVSGPISSRPTRRGNYEINQLAGRRFHVSVGKCQAMCRNCGMPLPAAGLLRLFLSGDRSSDFGIHFRLDQSISAGSGGAFPAQVSSGTGPLPAVESCGLGQLRINRRPWVSNALGEYSINGLVAGNYKVGQQTPVGMSTRCLACLAVALRRHAC